MKVKKTLLLLILSVSTIVITGCSIYYYPINDDDMGAENLTVSLVDDKQVIDVKGIIDIGVLNDIMLVYNENRATVNSIKLSSHSGFYSEAENIHHFIKKHGLDTYAYSQCYGPCAIAFAGGKNRYAIDDVNFRFYGDLSYEGDTAEAISQLHENTDRIRNARLLKKNGVKEEFIEKYINYKSKITWKPEKYEMLESNIVHEYISSDKYSMYINSNQKNSMVAFNMQTMSDCVSENQIFSQQSESFADETFFGITTNDLILVLYPNTTCRHTVTLEKDTNFYSSSKNGNWYKLRFLANNNEIDQAWIEGKYLFENVLIEGTGDESQVIESISRL